MHTASTPKKTFTALFCSIRLFLVLFLGLFFLPIVGAQSLPGGSDQQLRSFEEIFPGIGANLKNEAFSTGGFIHSLEKNESLEIIPATGSGINLQSAVMRGNPSFLAESLLVIPYQGRTLEKLDAYNALGRIRDLKGRLYSSHTRNAEVPLFEDATRLESPTKNNPVPDPQGASVLPISETVFIRLKDINFGNTYYRGEMTTSQHGVTYSLSNYRNITYLLFTVMKEGRFSAILYMEPLKEGMLVYSVAGADTSDFIASKIDIPSAISKRLAVFIGWINDGLTEKKL